MMPVIRFKGDTLVLLLFMLYLVACAPNTQAPAAPVSTPVGAASAAGPGGAKLDVVATTTILADIARHVAGDAATVTPLLPRGTDPHTFEPSPRDSQRVANAGLILENGAGLEEWLAPLIQNASTKAPIVSLSDGASVRKRRDPAQDEHGDEDDPHLWTDVQNVIAYTEKIRNALSAADPVNTALYQANAAAYSTQLQALDTYIVQQAQSIPASRRKLVTNHETFGYFADRYGFTVVGTVFPSVSAEAQPSAQDIARLVDTIKAEGLPAIFTESTVNPQLAAQIARDAGVTVVSDLYVDSLGEPGSAGDTYIKMMRYNIDQIVKALR